MCRKRKHLHCDESREHHQMTRMNDEAEPASQLPARGPGHSYAARRIGSSAASASSVVAEDSSFTPCFVYLWFESRAEIT